MKTINKLIKIAKKMVLGLAVVGLPLAASAQIGTTTSFINPNYIGLYISNAVTFATNLSSVVNGVGTNVTGMVQTNSAGVAVATNNIYNVNMLRTVTLWAERNGNICTNMGIFVKVPAATAGAAATNGFLLVFSPCPNGTNDSGQAGDFLQVSNGVGGTAVAGNWFFPLPTGKWPGCRGLMLQKAGSIVAPAAAASQFVITEISLSGFVP